MKGSDDIAAGSGNGFAHPLFVGVVLEHDVYLAFPNLTASAGHK